MFEWGDLKIPNPYTIMGHPRCAAPATLTFLAIFICEVYGSSLFKVFSVCCLFEWGDSTDSKSVQDIHSVAKVYAVLPFYDVKCLCSGGRE